MPKISNTYLFIAAFIPVANATYSIVAADATSRQVGGAGASCVPNRDIFEALYVSVPNRAVMHTQGLLLSRDSPIIAAALDKMAMKNETADHDVSDILEAMQEMDTDIFFADSLSSFPSVSLRQYGIADFTSHAAYTGQNLTRIYDLLFDFDFQTEQRDEGGSVTTKNGHTLVYHALANIVSSGTVDSLKHGFLREEGTDEGNEDEDASILAAKLMAAMESVASAGKGDGRCLNVPGGDSTGTVTGTSASGAFLHVDNADGTVHVHLNVIGDGTTEPIDELRKKYDTWRDGNEMTSSSGGMNTSSRRLWILSIFLAGVAVLFASL